VIDSPSFNGGSSSAPSMTNLPFAEARKPLAGQPGDSLTRFAASHQAMGTIFSIAAYGASSVFLKEAVRRAFREIDRLNHLMSHYRPESELSALNRNAHRKRVVVTHELFKIIEASLRYSEETHGAFDITVGSLMKSWGFFRRCGRMPSPPELAQALKQTGYRHVKLDAAARTVGFDKPGIELDLGAIGKGYAVDRAVEILRKEGIVQALVSSGTSSIYALGSPPGKHGWEVSVCHPRDRRKTTCSLRLEDLSVSISGDCENFFEIEDRIYSHLMDPNTGMPVQDILMTAVVSPSATQSDALSTSFLIGGVAKSRSYLECHPNLAAIVYRRAGSADRVEQLALKSKVTNIPACSFVGT
jgi:FAD:protein FMN transferase